MNREQELKLELTTQDARIRSIQEEIANLTKLLIIETAGRVAILKEINNQNID